MPKIRAYAKKGGQYVTETNGTLKKYYIWEALSIKQRDYNAFKELEFVSTYPKEEDRTVMTPVVSGFYKYKTTPSGITNEDGDNQSVSHSTAIEVLSEFKELRFKAGGDEFVLKFSELLAETVRLKFKNGEYIPDLYGVLEKSSDYYSKWAGRVALEVCVTHPCGPAKIQDFWTHCIPILQISLPPNTMRYPNELEHKPYDGKSHEAYYKFLNKKFGEVVYAEKLVDPVSSDHHLDILKKRDDAIMAERQSHLKTKDDLAIANLSVDALSQDQTKNSATIETQKITIASLKKRVTVIELEKSVFEKTISKLKERSLLDRIFNKDIEPSNTPGE